jgi:hypothetical protein
VEERDEERRHDSSLLERARNLNGDSEYGVSGRHRLPVALSVRVERRPNQDLELAVTSGVRRFRVAGIRSPAFRQAG